MKLELKHLAGYLPYGLKCLNQHLPDKEYLIEELKGIENHIVWSGKFDAKHGSNHIPIVGIKPILRPLSDLTKEIEINGEKFVPNNNSEFKYFIKHELEDFINSMPSVLMYDQLRKLLEWHFDIYGLIEKGLAIDINTL